MIGPKLLTILALLPPLSGCAADPGPRVVTVLPEPCRLPAFPEWPAIAPRACGEDVCLSPADTDALWLWARDVARWSELAQVCSDTADPAPLRWIPVILPPKLVPGADPVDLTEVREQMSVPGVEITLVWETCGEPNASYNPLTRAVTMCRELDLPPAALRQVARHELAHAIIGQRELPITGSGEDAADELAAVIAAVWGAQNDVFAIADYHQKLSNEGHKGCDWWDDHSCNNRRARVLRCLAMGSQGKDWLFGCTWHWRRALHTWARLLGAA